MKPPLLLLSIVLPSAVIGWFAGRSLRPAPTVAPAPAVKQEPAKSVPADLPSLIRPSRDPLLQDRWDFAKDLKIANEPTVAVLFDRARSYNDPVERKIRIQMVALRCAEVNPEKFIQEHASSDREFTRMIIEGWAALDGVTALEWVQNFKGLDRVFYSHDMVSKAFAAANPARYLQHMRTKGKATRGVPETYIAIFSSMANRDLEEAKSELVKVENPHLRLVGFDTIGQTWAKKDSGAALAWAKGLSEPHERSHALQGVLRSLAEKDPRAAIQALDLIDPSIQNLRGTAHGAIAAGLAKIDPKEAAAWVKSLDPTKHKIESLLASAVLPSLSKIDAAGLVEIFGGASVEGRGNDFSELVNTGRGMISVLKQWKPENITAVMKQTTELPQNEARDVVMNYLCWELSRRNPAEALTYAATASDFEKQRISAHLSKSLAEQGKLDQVIQAVNLTNDPAMLVENSRTASETLVKHHPDMADELLNQLPESARPAAAAKMVPELVARDPAAAIELANALPAESQPTQFSIVTSEWAKSSAADAGRWVGSLPPGEGRDAAAGGIVSALYQKNPKDAFGWARQITDPEIRASHLQAVVQEWIHQDAVTAQTLLAASGLPQSEVAAALIPPPDGHPNPLAKDRDFVDAPPVETQAPNVSPQ